MADDKRKLVESLMKAKLQEDGEVKARSYVEMPDVLLPEEEVESGASKRELQARMQRLAMMGAVGMGTTAMGAGIRDVGLTISTAKSEFGDGRIDVKSIAKKADSIAPKNVPRETARYLRSSSGEWSPSSPGAHRKTPLESHASRRSGSVSSQGSSSEANSLGGNKSRRASSAILAKAASSSAETTEGASSSAVAADTVEQPRLEKSHSTSSSVEAEPRAVTPASPGGVMVKSPIVSPKSSLDETSRSSAPPKSPALSPTSPSRGAHVVGASTSKQQQGFSVGSPAAVSKPSESVFSIKSPSDPIVLRPAAIEQFKQMSMSKSTAAASSPSSFIPKPGAVTSPTKALTKPSVLASPLVSSKAGGSATKAPMSFANKASAASAPAVVVAVEEEQDTDPNRKYTLEELQKGTPEGVNGSRKEEYLKIGAFKKQFGCDPDTFAKYPEWKKLNLRKDAKLF